MRYYGKKKAVRIAAVILIIIAAIAVDIIVTPYRNLYLADIMQDITYTNYDVSELSREQMKADLDYMIDCIQKTTYYEDEMRSVYGYSLEDRREHYYELLDKCENNADFYILLSLVTSECGSAHSAMTYCNSYSYTSMYVFNSDILNLRPNNGGIGDGWYDYLSEAVSDYRERLYESDTLPFYVFIYYGSEYISAVQDDLDYCYITEINGSTPNSFINSHDSTWQLRHDFITNENFRYYYYLLKEPTPNSEEVELTLRFADGSEEIVTCYYDFFEIERYILAEQYLGEAGEDFNMYDGIDEISEDDYYIDTDSNTNTAYIKLTSFNYLDGETLMNRIAEVAGCDNIIIDVRENGGGFVGFWEDYIYSALFVAEADNTSHSYIEIGDYYMNIFYGLRYTCVDFDIIEKISADELPVNVNSTNKWYHVASTQGISGNYTGINHNREIAVLADNLTCSCADDFVSYFKNSGLASVYGTNTAGEGMAVTFGEWRLPESKLLFTCGYGLMLNPDGSSSTVYGTAPDVYVPVDIDAFNEARVRRDCGEDIYSIESRLTYDSVLIKAYKDITANDQKAAD